MKAHLFHRIANDLAPAAFVSGEIKSRLAPEEGAPRWPRVVSILWRAIVIN
jgi:hypothetical protein